MKKPNVVVAGDAIYAGIDEDEQTEIKNAIVIEFESAQQMREILRSRKMEFDFFRDDSEPVSG